MMNCLKKSLPLVLPALALWTILAFFQKDFLIFNGDTSLFLFEWDFINDSFSIPGGFLNIVGAFFTQFLLMPWLGALLWILLLMLAGLITVRVFEIPETWYALASLPVSLLVIANVSLGYKIYTMGTFDHFFAPVLGYICMLGIIGIIWNSRNMWQAMAITFISAFAGYQLVGIFAFAGVISAWTGTALMPDCNEKSEGRKNAYRIISPLLALAFCVAAPFVSFRLFTTFGMSESWKLGLPYVKLAEYDKVPFWVLFGLSVALASARPFFAHFSSQRNKGIVSNCLIAAISILSVAFFWYRDPNFKTEIKMSVAADNFDWQKVERIYQEVSAKNIVREEKAYKDMSRELAGVTDNKIYSKVMTKYSRRIFNPTRFMVVLRDLALLKQNKALDTAFSMRDGNMPQRTDIPVFVSLENGPQVFFNYGLVNIAYHWCMEKQTISGWNYSLLKYMAMYGVVMNETDFAEKFLGKLEKTLFYHNWSRHQRALAKDARTMSTSLPYREILPYMCFEDGIAEYDDGDYELFFINHFFRNRGNMATPEFDRAALLWAMRYKDSSMFWKAFVQFLDTDKSAGLPKNVQEAAILFCAIEKDNLDIPFSREVVGGFQKFQDYFKTNDISKVPKYQFLRNFGDTYYYYYYSGNVYSFKL